MRFYQNKKTGSFVCVHLETKKVSYTSSYPETFLSRLKDGTYKFSDFSERNVSKANENKICFSERFDDLGSKFEAQTFHYIGDACNTDELFKILGVKDIPNKKDSISKKILKEIDNYTKKLKKTKSQYDEARIKGIIEGLELSLSTFENIKS